MKLSTGQMMKAVECSEELTVSEMLTPSWSFRKRIEWRCGASFVSCSYEGYTKPKTSQRGASGARSMERMSSRSQCLILLEIPATFKVTAIQ